MHIFDGHDRLLSTGVAYRIPRYTCTAPVGLVLCYHGGGTYRTHGGRMPAGVYRSGHPVQAIRFAANALYGQKGRQA